MDSTERNENIVKKFTNKFVKNYIVSVILIGIVSSVIIEILSVFIPQSILFIINFTLTTLLLWKVSITTVDVSLMEAKIDYSNVKDTRKNIYIFFSILIAIYAILKILTAILSASIQQIDAYSITLSTIISMISIVLQYVAMMIFCRNRLNQKVLGDSSHNLLYITILAIAVVVLSCGVFYGTSNKNNLSEENAIMGKKYEDSDWEEIEFSSSTSEDLGDININVSLGHSEEGVVENYKVVRIVCYAYKESDNTLIGNCEEYFENVKLEYGYMSFRKSFSIKSKNIFLGDDYRVEIEAYGVKEK